MSLVEKKRTASRSVAIPMIGIGAASCSSIEMVQARWPDLAALPGAVGSVCALLGVLLLFRSQLAAARAEKARKEACVRISPYIPEMVDGSNGAEMLKIAMAPLPQTIVARAHAVLKPISQAAHDPVDGVSPFFTGETARAMRVPKRGRADASATLISALRLGSEWSSDLQLNGRAQARLESDPFVQRLGRLA